MLYANHMRSFNAARPQEEIIHLVTTAQNVADEELPFVFYDQHAITDYATPYNHLDDLHEIDWELFFETPLMGLYSQYWQDRYDEAHPKWVNRAAIRQAEFLVHKTLPWQLISQIGTKNAVCF